VTDCVALTSPALVTLRAPFTWPGASALATGTVRVPPWGLTTLPGLLYSNAKTRFQSFFMLITPQPLAVASSISD
jgi:hypothetical protein